MCTIPPPLHLPRLPSAFFFLMSLPPTRASCRCILHCINALCITFRSVLALTPCLLPRAKLCISNHPDKLTLMRYGGKPCAEATFEAVCARYQERQQASNRIVHCGCTLCSLEPSSLATSPFCLLLSHVIATHLLLAVVPLGHQNYHQQQPHVAPNHADRSTVLPTHMPIAHCHAIHGRPSTSTEHVAPYSQVPASVSFPPSSPPLRGLFLLSCLGRFRCTAQATSLFAHVYPRLSF